MEPEQAGWFKRTVELLPELTGNHFCDDLLRYDLR